MQASLALRALIAAFVLTSVLAGCEDTPSDAKGAVPIIIHFASLPHETVDLAADPKNDLSRAQKDTLRITAGDVPVRWFIDGEEQAGTDSAITIAAIDYPVGTHHVTALAYKDDVPYSNELTFKIVK